MGKIDTSTGPLGQDIKDRPDKPYYIELAITHPGDLPLADKTTFYAVLTEAQRSRDAEKEAFDMARRAHPNAENIEHYMSRTGANMNEKRVEHIRREMELGTWGGWEFG